MQCGSTDYFFFFFFFFFFFLFVTALPFSCSSPIFLASANLTWARLSPRKGFAPAPRRL